MRPISRLRFDSLAGYSRTPWLRLIIHELAWFEEADEKVLGMLALDLPDDDYVCFVLGRDKKGCFRAVWSCSSIPTAEEAYSVLERQLAERAQMPPEEFYQDDEVGRPLDFFTPLDKPERLHPRFRTMISKRGYSPARSLLAEIMHYFEDIDGNFVRDFQTDNFDARIWELYLYALFTELGYGFNRSNAAPDFHCHGPLGEFFVEATTVNPSNPPLAPDTVGGQDYFEHYVPLKFGSVLKTKLDKKHQGKKYWELPHVVGHPFVIAVQDFHGPQSMSWSSSSLVEYLYGIRQVERIKDDGTNEIVSEQVKSYRKANGEEIPAGFFLQPNTENISAVLANSEGTLSKFNRIGFLAGFSDRSIRMIRAGHCYQDSLTAQEFVSEVHSSDYSETWCEGVSIYHNPRAINPLSPAMIPGGAHHSSRNGRILSQMPHFHPVGSLTCIVAPT